LKLDTSSPPPSSASANSALRLGCHSCHATARNDLKRHVYALANAVQERVVARPGAIEHLHGPRNVECGPREFVVLSIGRDAAPWMESLIEHHLALGAKHVFFLDNASEDDTVQRAARYRSVTVFRTGLSFRRYEVGLRRWLVRSFGRHRWSLYCDADELFDYPFSDRLPMPGLLAYLAQHRYNAMTGQMLDLFSDKPFSQLAADPGDILREKYRYYDLTDLVATRQVYWIRDGDVASGEIPCYFGGIRKRFFADDCLLLSKHPLIYADDSFGVYSYDGHFMTGARVADISAVLLHYKYIGALPARVRKSVNGEWHTWGSLYGGLAAALESNPDLCLKLDSARELSSVNELVNNGFLAVSDRYREWVDRFPGRPA
jgi:hypothetical protein